MRALVACTAASRRSARRFAPEVPDAVSDPNVPDDQIGKECNAQENAGVEHGRTEDPRPRNPNHEPDECTDEDALA